MVYSNKSNSLEVLIEANFFLGGNSLTLLSKHLASVEPVSGRTVLFSIISRINPPVSFTSNKQAVFGYCLPFIVCNPVLAIWNVYSSVFYFVHVASIAGNTPVIVLMTVIVGRFLF